MDTTGSGGNISEQSINDDAVTLMDMEVDNVEQEPVWQDPPCFFLSDVVLRSLDINTGKGSLCHQLDKCCTPQGKRLLLEWISKPLLDVAAIEKRLDLVEYFVQNPVIRRSVSEIHLKKFPDFTPLVKKLQRKSVSLQDLYRLYGAIQRIPALISAVCPASDAVVSNSTALLLQEQFVKPLRQLHGNFANYQKLIEETIDMNYHRRNGEYRIKPTIGQELQELDGNLDELIQEMHKDWKKTSRDTELPQEKVLKLEPDHRLGYLYRVTRKDEKLLRNSGIKIIVVDTKIAGHRFRTPKLAQLNTEYLAISAKYRKEQEKALEAVVTAAVTYVEPLKTLDKVLAPLDVFAALGQVAYEARTPYVRPKILPKESGIIELMESRHPCIESFMDRDFIPNSIRFKSDEVTFHIITGPNMGGKSTYIRQIALNIIMAQIGSFVPCRTATVSLVDNVFTRIGAGDSVTKGVSTFMMEMLEIQSILKCASKYSLIIIDELGRGTSTYDGYGLAYAISESIANELQSYCMLTTHFNELADLKNTTKNVAISHVAALVLEGGITFQYLVEPGVCSQSFGINVAQMAGIPSHVIEDSKEVLHELESSHKKGLEQLAIQSATPAAPASSRSL